MKNKRKKLFQTAIKIIFIALLGSVLVYGIGLMSGANLEERIIAASIAGLVLSVSLIIIRIPGVIIQYNYKFGIMIAFVVVAILALIFTFLWSLIFGGIVFLAVSAKDLKEKLIEFWNLMERKLFQAQG
jgi:membrane-associated HD superfamily phosphohydrolase